MKTFLSLTEPDDAFATRELDDFKMLLYPKRDDRSYQEIVDDKINHVNQEVRDPAVICDRRRFSMLSEGVLSPQLYLCALSDFILTIAETYQEKLRPSQGDGRRGRYYAFEEGILCQTRTVHPGLEAKCTTGDSRYAGWFAAVLAVIRRMILNRNDWNHHEALTMGYCNLNFAKLDKTKAITLMTSLKRHCETIASDHHRRRGYSHSGRLVFDFINEAAAIVKRLFVADTRERLNRANQVFQNPIENDQCFANLNTTNNKTVLRFCSRCRGKFDYA